MSNLLVVLLGPPGSGKGTQGALLSERSSMKHISTGDLLRANIIAGSELGKKAEALQKTGSYVDDETMIAMISEVLTGKEPILLDGFPRTGPQALALDCLAAAKDMKILPVLLEVDNDILSRRLTGRLTHPASGRVYHTETAPPKSPIKDDFTGEPLVRRPDDAPELIARRLEIYQSGIAPVLEHYENNGLVRVEASRLAEEVTASLEDIIEKAFTPVPTGLEF